MNAVTVPEPEQAPNDRGSLPMAMLVTMVALSLGATMAPLVINQVTATRKSVARNGVLDGTQAGIDVGLAQIRAAADLTGDGLLERLPPCTLTGLLGAADADPAIGYDVEITYYDSEGNTLGCPPNEVPATALLRATGTGVAGSGASTTRAIEATYTFRTSNANTDGGSIRLASPTANPLCLDSGSTKAPTSGQKVKLQVCIPGSSRQRFAYNRYLNLLLVGSETKAYPLGMCLDAGPSQTNNAVVAFQPCKDPKVGQQQWSLNDVSNFRGSTNGTSANGLCFNAKNPGTVDSDIILGSCGGGDNVRVFRSEAGVGAGMAGTATGQLVNFKQFSRCLDVTNQSPTYSYMIVWFCKQAPDGNVTWNQKWTYASPVAPAVTATGPIRSGNSTSYCLKSPGSTATNQYVSMETCATSGTMPQRLQWTVYGDTNDYSTGYQIVDGWGFCLTPTSLDATPLDVHTDGTAKVKVAPCDGSELQKWNAPPNFGKALPLTNISED